MCALSSAFADDAPGDADHTSIPSNAIEAGAVLGDARRSSVAEWRGSVGGGQLAAHLAEAGSGRAHGSELRAAAPGASFKALSESAGLISTQHVKQYLPSALKRIAALESQLLLHRPPSLAPAPIPPPPAAAAETVAAGEVLPSVGGASDVAGAGAQDGGTDEGEEVAPLSPRWLSDAPSSDDKFRREGGGGGVDESGRKAGEGGGSAATLRGSGAGWQDQVVALVCASWCPCKGLGVRVQVRGLRVWG